MDGYWKIYFELNGVSESDTKDFCRRLSEKAEEACFYLHPIKDKTGQQLPHIHGYLFNWSQSDDTCRSEIKKQFSVKGAQLGVSNTYKRGTQMTKECLPPYVSYMTKGKFQPFFLKNVDANECERLRTEWKSPTTVRISGDLTIIANEVKRKEITQASMAREVSVWILEQKAANVIISKDDVIDKAESILKGYGKSRHYRNVANIVQDALWDWDREYVRAKIKSML